MTTRKTIWRSAHAIGLLQSVPTPAGVYCPWMSREEWEAVYEWLYNGDSDLMKKGVGRVSAWKARGEVPMAVEMTADLTECKLLENDDSALGRSMYLSYVMAISRFVNGVNELMVIKLGSCGSIAANVEKFNIPTWLVDLRHQGTHEKLPSLGALRTGAEFSLSWLRSNYWEPQKEFLAQSNVCEVEDPRKKGVVWKQTQGLCNTKAELIDLLSTSSSNDLSKWLKRKQLLYFPDNVQYKVKAPDTSDLTSFPELTVSQDDLALWRVPLLKACSRDITSKHRMVCALITVVNSSNCFPDMRDYLGSWLGLLLVENYEVKEKEGGRKEVVEIVDDDDQFLPAGGLDWKALLNVTKDHPGYYSYTLINIITQHLISVMKEPVREQVLYLSSLVTISGRIGSSSYIQGTSSSGPYHKEFEQKKMETELELKKKEGSSVGMKRWSHVQDMSQWVHTPLGLCPGQTLSPTIFDEPTATSMDH